MATLDALIGQIEDGALHSQDDLGAEALFNHVSDNPNAALIALIIAQQDLMRVVGYGERGVGDMVAGYKWRHLELQKQLHLLDSPCYCPWDHLGAWLIYLANRCDNDVEVGLQRLWDAIEPVINVRPEAKTHELVPHPRWAAFVKDLSEFEQGRLDEMLLKDLAVNGLSLLVDRTKLEAYRCNKGGKVYGYKIQQESKRAAIKLRIWFETREDGAFVLLNGFNKLHNDNVDEENRAKEVACGRRGDVGLT